MKNQSFLQWMVQVVNYDFCPQFNVLVYWLKEPIGWVISAIAFSLLVGLMVGPQGYVLAFSFFALLVLGLAWPWLSMKGIQCQLILPDRRVEENQELELVFRVRNYWPLPVFGLMVNGEFLQESYESEPIAFSLKRVGAWSESEFRISITPRRRGVLPTGSVTVASGFPFGLKDVSKTVDDFQPTLVWPTCVPLEGFPVSESTRFSLQGPLRDKSGNDGDSIGVRVYRIGDRLRNIHWAQSARSQKLMVRERQSISSTGATVFLDLSPDDHDGIGISSSFEWSIRIAASICSHLHETQSPVRVVSWGLPNQTQLFEDNRNGIRPIMDFLASLPTLPGALNTIEELKASEGPLEQPSGSIFSYADSSNGHFFVIGSNQSANVRPVGSRDFVSKVTPVIVEIDGFNSKDELPLIGVATEVSDERQSYNKNSILIETPQSAAESLGSGWDRSFSDAV